MNKINKRKTYALINAQTKKIIKYEGKLQYFRTVTAALRKLPKLKKELKIEIKIKKC